MKKMACKNVKRFLLRRMGWDWAVNIVPQLVPSFGEARMQPFHFGA